MGVITTIEEALVAAVQTALGNTVKKVETLGGAWTLDALKRALQAAPGVYVAFLGGQRGISSGYIDGRFAIYIVTKGALEAARRQGTPREIGAYDIIERLVPRIDDMYITDIGTCNLRDLSNLFQDAMFDLGGAVYGITLSVGNMPFDYTLDPLTLEPFVTFHNTQQIGDANTVDLEGELTLPQ